MNQFFNRLSLSRQFLLLSFPILLAASLAIGWWIGEQVKDSVVHRLGGVTALYVGGFIAPHLQRLSDGGSLDASDRDALKSDLVNTALGQKIVALKVWSRAGAVLFSSEVQEAGKVFPIGEGLAEALAGNIFSEISERSSAEREQHGQPLPRLIETYTPIHADRSGSIIAAAEFYLRPDDVDREAAAAQQRGWFIVAAVMGTMYLLLFILVRKGSKTIIVQQEQLSDKVQQLTALNERNRHLQARVIRAAERATGVNEQLLQRVSANIHDGPVQDLGFALMQLKNLDDALRAGPAAMAPVTQLAPACVALQSALGDLRSISADLDLPDIEPLSPREIADRVVRDFQGKTGQVVELSGEPVAPLVSFRVKVTLYRVLQECLANALRHAGCRGCKVRLAGSGATLMVEVSDDGPGFDPVAAASKGRFGLHGMRQRVEVVGGVFEVQSAPGHGTVIRITLPHTTPAKDDD
jgi:signal transduction histidine kinase